jgi:hypothetical protein
MTDAIVRFSKKQRLEHLIVMILFTLLAVTGFPQKFYEARWAGVVVNAIGGLDRLRWLPRWRLLFSVATVFHIGRDAPRPMRPGLSMVRRQDQDAIQRSAGASAWLGAPPGSNGTTTGEIRVLGMLIKPRHGRHG